MSTMVTVRRLRARRERRRGGAPLWLIGLLALVALGFAGAAAGVGTVFAVYQHYAKDYVPIEEKLQQRNVGLTTIFDRYGNELGVLPNSDAQLLKPVPLDEISEHMIWATVSTEDNSFFSHPGISYTGILRAAYENYIGGGIGTGSGGSSITQQLVKNVYICPAVTEDGSVCVAERTLDRKLREIAYALELERDYTKEQILGWYLNQISYADRYVGVQAAAQGYFRKDAKDLTLAEAAMLAGIPAAPTAYHPRLNCEKDERGDCIVDELGRTKVTGAAKERQETVLDLMVAHGRATREEVEAAKAEELFVFAATSTRQASAFIDNQVEPRLVRMCEAGVLPLLQGADDCETSVRRAGWEVITTLDLEETRRATNMINQFIRDGLEAGCNCHNAAIVTIDPGTGQVIIYAANRDETWVSDRRVAGEIDQLVEINQPGSSFKPVVYLTWFDLLGKAPMNTFWDTSPLTVEGTAITNPRPAPRTEGLISARAGLGGSQNVPAFRAAQEAGPDNVIEMAKRVGITTLDQHFDPTFRAHPEVTYGASIATGGANIRAIDMAYMNSVIANMGVMVGVPHYAETVEVSKFKSFALDVGADYELALQQYRDFQLGHIRLPGTRELDPVVVLEVRDQDGEVIFRQGEPERRQVVDPGSVWLLHSIMSDCNARFIIWGCGTSNDDRRLDAFDLDGVRIPMGVKTGTQQGPLSAVDTLETWMNGYSRYAATAVWVGNANNDLVNDGPQYGYAAANTTIWLFKHWMGEYHSYLKSQGVIAGEYLGFDDLQPPNVAYGDFKTPATDRILRSGDKKAGGCDQVVQAWYRTDVEYESECEEVEIDTRNGLLAGPETPAQFVEKREFVKLPELEPKLAIELAKDPPEWAFIPIAPETTSTGQEALAIASPQSGDIIRSDAVISGSVNVDRLTGWKLEIGHGAAPADDEWQVLAEGTEPIAGALALLEVEGYEAGVYTIRLSADGAAIRGLVVRVLVNLRPGEPEPSPTVSPTPTPRGGNVPPPPPTWTPTPTPPGNETPPPPPPPATETP